MTFQAVQKTGDNIRLYHTDHLGSTALVTDLDGEVTQHVAYIPYGEIFVEQRNGSWSSPYLFNAKELDEETGLYYYGARYLDPTGTRWLSVDPLFEKYVGASPYNYCHGNPITLIDPDGMDEWEVDQQGYFVKICENKDQDIIYGVNAEGNRVSEISFSYGTIESMFEESKTYNDGEFTLSYINVNKNTSATDLFEFLSQPASYDAETNTGVEWSLILMDGETMLSSSHETDCDRAGYEMLKKRRGECFVYEHYHNHPNNNPTPSGTGGVNGDIQFIKLLKKWKMASDITLFSIYTPINKRYEDYNEDTTYKVPEIEIFYKKQDK